MWYDVLTDALLDTLKLFPFLFVLYLLIEALEHRTDVGRPHRALTGKVGPVLGAATGLLPMCGFSVMAAKLYRHRHITAGTLIAVFVATSDEGLIVLLFSGLAWDAKLYSALALLGCKLVLGILAGYAVDLVCRRPLAPLPPPHSHDHSHDHSRPQDGGEEAHEHGDCGCDELSPCEHKHGSAVQLYLLSPLAHASEVALCVFAVNLAFGCFFFLLEEARVVAFLQGAGYWYQPLVCALIGAIPNCASSVVLAEVYALGGIGFGGLLGGLVTNAGLGYLVLFRRNAARGAAVLAGMLLFGIAVGYLAGAVQFAAFG